MSVIAIITLCWAFIYGPWALATFIELMMGYAVAKEIRKHMGGEKSQRMHKNLNKNRKG